MTRDTDHRLGFASLTQEVTLDQLPVQGTVPGWLSGVLVRNGPALFEHGKKSFRHWFDGQAMLHRFAIDGNQVGYTNRMLDTPGLRSLRERGRIGYAEFATDPCGSLFGRFFTRFTRKPSTNANVNVTAIAGRPAAVSEVPLAIQFDPATLAAAGVTDYSGGLTGGAVTTAHPHAVPGGGDLVNYVLKFGRDSEYIVYRRATGDQHGAEVARWAARRPGYVHSFAVTEHYLLLAVFPLVVNPVSLLLAGRPFIENYRWRPELGLRIVVFDLDGGGVQGEHTAPAAFAFHHINAYEDGDRVVMDLCAFPDASIVKALYLDPLRSGRPVPMAKPTRYEIPLAGPGEVEVSTLASDALELPRINYGAYNGRAYRYAYGVGAADPGGGNFLDQLCKLDVSTGQTRTWRADACYPGEPVFIAAPGASAEDDGVLLSVVLDAAAGTSFLLVLEAASMRELARAQAPHPIPFGFHGQFSRSGGG